MSFSLTDRTGVLLVNLGTPDAPTPAALRKYLAEFLWDRRVVELPRPLWWLILHGIVLRTRPARSAAAYARVWQPAGSPLLTTSLAQRDALASELGGSVPVAVGMRYGNPSLKLAVDALLGQGCSRIVVLPLYPQYAGATTGSTFDALAAALLPLRRVPGLCFIDHYHDHPAYIAALGDSVRRHWQAHGRGERLLISFHGIPQSYADAGDPYPQQCRRTAELLASELGLAAGEWQLCYQSRFGKEPWVQPYTDATLEAWGQAGVGKVDAICPGFAADCLETVDEIAVENRHLFIEAGGGDLRYIPALNADPAHIDLLADLVRQRL